MSIQRCALCGLLYALLAWLVFGCAAPALSPEQDRVGPAQPHLDPRVEALGKQGCDLLMAQGKKTRWVPGERVLHPDGFNWTVTEGRCE